MYALNVTKNFRWANTPVDGVRYSWIRQGDDGARTALLSEELTGVDSTGALGELYSTCLSLVIHLLQCAKNRHTSTLYEQKSEYMTVLAFAAVMTLMGRHLAGADLCGRESMLITCWKGTCCLSLFSGTDRLLSNCTKVQLNHLLLQQKKKDGFHGCLFGQHRRKSSFFSKQNAEGKEGE